MAYKIVARCLVKSTFSQTFLAVACCRRRWALYGEKAEGSIFSSEEICIL